MRETFSSDVAEHPVRLLAVDDDPDVLRLLRVLMPGNFQMQTCMTGRDCLATMPDFKPEMASVDLMLPDINGIDLLRQLRKLEPALEVVLLTATYSTDAAVEAIRAGASDYVTKPIQIDRFRQAIERSVATIETRRAGDSLERELARTSSFEGMVGRSVAMRSLFEAIRKIGPHFRSALVSGATGTGKELVARALHRHSPHRDGPIVVCNCAAIPDTIVESALFGHNKGAFTGATESSNGYFGQAQGGVLVLDEIGELPMQTQAKLLRAVQFSEVQRVGAPQPTRVNVRIIASTNRNLMDCVRTGTFREDLFYRLGMFHLVLPALVERREDMPLLIRHFLSRSQREYEKELAGFTPAAEELLFQHSWPGNIRELEQVIGYGSVMTDSRWIDVPHLPAHLIRKPAQETSQMSIEEAENRHVLAVLAQTGNDKTAAAALLGVSRATMYRLAKRAQSARA